MHKYRSYGPNKVNLWSFYNLKFILTLTFNLTEQIFQMALLLLKENNCAKLFRNRCIHVQDIVQRNSIYDHLINWLSSVTLTCNQPEQMFQMALQLVAGNNCAKLFRNPWINVQASYGLYKLNFWSFHHLTFKCNLDLQPTSAKALALLLFKKNNRAKLFRNPCINVQVMVWARSM